MQVQYTDTKLKEYNEREERFRLAVEEATNNKTASINSIANKYKVSRTTLSRRIHGFKNTRNSHEKQQKFTNSEENQIVDSIVRLLNAPSKEVPQKREILTVCEDLLKVKFKDENLDPDSNVFKVGKNWIDRFLERHNDRLKLDTGVTLSEYYKNEFLQKKKLKTHYTGPASFSQPPVAANGSGGGNASSVPAMDMQSSSAQMNPLQYQQAQQPMNPYGQLQPQQSSYNNQLSSAKSDPFLYPSEQQPGQSQPQSQSAHRSGESSASSSPSQMNTQHYPTPQLQQSQISSASSQQQQPQQQQQVSVSQLQQQQHQQHQQHQQQQGQMFGSGQYGQQHMPYSYYNNGNGINGSISNPGGSVQFYRNPSSSFPSYQPPQSQAPTPQPQQQVNYQYNNNNSNIPNQLYDRYNNISSTSISQSLGSFTFPSYGPQQPQQQPQHQPQLQQATPANPSTSSTSSSEPIIGKPPISVKPSQPYQPTQYDLLRYYQNNKFQYHRIQQDILRKLEPSNMDHGHENGNDERVLEACKLINFAFEQFERDLNWNNVY